MAPDLDELLRATAPRPDAALDIEHVRSRVRRRRWTRRGLSAGSLVTVVAIAAIVVPGIDDQPRIPDIVDQPTEAPAPEGGSAVDPRVGPELDLDAFPALSDHGAAVEQDGRIVFVGIDGTVHGHVRGRFHPHPSLQTVTHLLPIATGDDHRWLDPATGASMGIANVEVPLIGGHQITYFAHLPADASQELVRVTSTADGEAAEPLDAWPEYTPYWVTPDHRVVTYLPCGDDSCPRAYDLDMGGARDLDAGCHVAAVLGDLATTEVCADGRELRVWDPAGDGPGARRTVSVPDGTDAEPARAVSVFGDVVHVAHATCGVHEAMVVAGGELVPLLSGPSVEERGRVPSHLPLGTLPDDRVLLHYHSGAACDAGAPQPGVHVYDRATGESSTVHATSVPAGRIRMWAPSSALSSQPGVALAPGDAGGEVTRRTARAAV